MKLFAPRLAGATLANRMVAGAGALAGIGLTGVIATFVTGTPQNAPQLFAPLGASALLVFAVPASPLAQPWAVIGGNTISSIVGLAVALMIPDRLLAASIAVGLAIVIMSLARCLHPPGGAVAFMAAMGGPAIAEAGLMFPLMPVAVDSLLLVTIGLLFHRLIGQSYPHRAQPVMASHKTEDAPAQLRANLLAQDIDAVLAEAGETHDISREDLNRILRRAEQRALARSHRIPSCADLMARDVIRVSAGQPPDLARHLLLHHAVRTLPVVDIDNRVIGTVGLRELTLPASRVDEVMSAAVTARPDQPVLSLLDPLTTGRSHAVMITDDEGRLLGLVSQTDLLVALSRLKARQAGAAGEPALSS